MEKHTMKMYKSIFRKGSHTYLTPDEFSMLLQIILMSTETTGETIELIGNNFTVYNSLLDKGYIKEDEENQTEYVEIKADIQYFIIELESYKRLKDEKCSNNEIYLYYMMEAIEEATYGEAMNATGLERNEIEKTIKRIEMYGG